MRWKLAALGGVFMLCAMVPGTTLSVASAGENETVLRFRGKITEQTFLDLGEQGVTLGDQFVWHDVLRQGGERIGHDGGVCTVTSVEQRATQSLCQVTGWFSEGQITFQGLIAQTGEFPERLVYAVTGGTGQYEGAAGEALVIRKSETLARIIVHLAE